MARAKEKGTKSGKSIGRPKLAEPIREQIRLAYEQGRTARRNRRCRHRSRWHCDRLRN